MVNYANDKVKVNVTNMLDKKDKIVIFLNV